MSMLSLREAATLIPGATILGDETTVFDRISTDSRTAGPGDLFVALKGERFDAHEFLGEITERRVSAALVSRSPADWRLPALRVPDTRAALAELARGWRAKFTLPLVAVTGSNGKTTVKGMIASIFAAAVGETARLATAGNLNNDIGVPLTLLRLNAAHRLAVVELGMNHPGETELLARIAQPTIALINNAQREHQEFMSTVEAVALEHASVIHALPDHAHAVFPADDTYAAIWRVAATDRQIVDFVLNPAPQHAAAVIRGEHRADGALHVDTPDGAFDAVLHVIGDHNLRNALAATAAAWSAGVPLAAIKAGLEQFEPVAGRLQRKSARLAPFAGVQLIDDTYNANPDSMRAAIAVLAAEAHPRVLVIGDMGEVGDYSTAFHREIGEFAREQGIDAMYALGAESQASVEAFGEQGMHFDTVEALLAELTEKAAGTPARNTAGSTAGDTKAAGSTAGPFARGTILVKGSRFMRMERVVRALTLEAAPGQPGAH
ncbi:UDP-N-acetylmuramoyl-tripeptide--D-alanyl-D-alanine ligase [Pararobbsia alpina]|uniref:UDP-N-acetylmuramoyl-tripeptide--D-alanyl-D-alanine ligase n=1 Tax=Pararobbsia alpina TaxID=621374 RepID=A0A6S7AZU3_9BURK|nr:UDP-N-acetylmuramoyl-tripeptide--D-alanyl-D-alanine ligase [Pararobbsia alpina]CAB3777667.1 UDP-N-acetylmuramoyl-tripeptide--D-alanyl-D-alanine ligase [Pararobbsia alpina]